MFRVELSKQVRRWRTWLLAAALAGVPVLVVIAVRLSPPPPQNSQDAPPFLPTHGWLGYTGLFRFPVDLVTMREGLTVSAAYTAVFLALAVWQFRRRDITA